MESYPLDAFGRPVMKSIVISSHFQAGIGNGWRVPASLRCSAFTLQQTSHLATNLAISCFRPFHQNLFLTSLNILLLLGWIEKSDSWTSFRICFFRSFWLGTTSLFPNHKVFEWSKRKLLYFGSFILSLMVIDFHLSVALL